MRAADVKLLQAESGETLRCGFFFCGAFSVQQPYNKRTMEAGWWGNLGRYAGCRINKLRVIGVMK
jgi:hypothetical protein